MTDKIFSFISSQSFRLSDTLLQRHKVIPQNVMDLNYCCDKRHVLERKICQKYDRNTEFDMMAEIHI